MALRVLESIGDVTVGFVRLEIGIRRQFGRNRWLSESGSLFDSVSRLKNRASAMPHLLLDSLDLLLSEKKSTSTDVPEILLCPRGGHDPSRRVGVVT